MKYQKNAIFYFPETINQPKQVTEWPNMVKHCVICLFSYREIHWRLYRPLRPLLAGSGPAAGQGSVAVSVSRISALKLTEQVDGLLLALTLDSFPATGHSAAIGAAVPVWL